jgi:hypothetical protein
MNGSKKTIFRNLRRYLLGTRESNAQKMFFFGKILMFLKIVVNEIYRVQLVSGYFFYQFPVGRNPPDTDCEEKEKDCKGSRTDNQQPGAIGDND